MSKFSISPSLRQKVSETAKFRCGYCLTQEVVIGMPMVIDHIYPEAFGGISDENNLWLACRRCNEFKGVQTEGMDPETNSQVPLFNPRTQKWTDHFNWTNEGLIIVGLTSVGRATIETLKMNNDFIVRSRKRWVSVGWHPPTN